MLNLNAKIIVYETDKLKPTDTSYEFRYVKNVVINSSYKTLTDTATITMPKKIFTNTEGFNISKFANATGDNSKKTIHDFFKLENYVEIFLGYNGDYKPAFRGYITAVKGDAPVTITCEDAMYACKKVKAVEDNDLNDEQDDLNIIDSNPTINIEKFNPKTYFEKRLKDLDFPFKVNAIDEEAGEFLIKRDQTICQVLEKLKDKGIYSFFKTEDKEPVLTITNNPQRYDANELGDFVDRNFIKPPKGTGFGKDLLKKGIGLINNTIKDLETVFKSDLFLGETRFRFHHNIISDNLVKVEESVKNTRYRGEVFYANSNTSISTEIGDSKGEIKKTFKLHKNDEMLPTNKEAFNKKVDEVRTELTNYVSKRAAEERPSGLKGCFTTFGEPFVRPTDKVILENAEDQDKNGTFQVTEVKRTYGVSGYRQEIHLGRLVNNK